MIEHLVVFDARHHSADAVQRAAYRFSDRLALDLEDDGDQLRCRLTFLDTDIDEEATVAQFKIEVLDQVLRERIREETKDVRNLVLALAFSNAALDDDTSPP
jgi:His-Xaa-Ser system protein HxsD